LSKPAESMRRDWDGRARRDAFFYIASWKKGWKEDSFLESGEQDYQRLIADPLKRLDFAPDGKSALELGCGAGRMTASLARRFARVAALDISAEMLDRARRLHSGVRNVEWIQANGTDLAGIADGTVDFVFSYLVLQHLPQESLVGGYMGEFFRVMSPAGLCLVQFNGSTDANMNWRGRATWRVLDSLWTIGLGGMGKALARALGLDSEMVGKNWHGVAVSSARMGAMVKQSGGTVLELRGDGSPMAWCCARKGTDSPAFTSV
jgi:SAM-dependent methyltransferase